MERMMQKPVEAVAAVLVGHMDSYNAIGFHTKFPLAPGTGGWPIDYSRVEQSAARLAAIAAITRLRELGFINAIGLAALKAEGDTIIAAQRLRAAQIVEADT